MHQFLPRTIIIIVMISFSFFSLNAQNQPGDDERSPDEIRSLSVCFAFFPDTPEWFFRNSEGEFEDLKSSTSGFQVTNQIPNRSEITFYRDVIDDEGNRSKQPATSVNLPDGEGPARLLYYLDERGKPSRMVFGDSAETHPEFSVRVLNLLDEPIVVLLGQLEGGSAERKMVPPKSGEVLSPVKVANELFQFLYYRQGESGKPVKSSATNMIYRGPGQRYTAVVGYKPLYRYTEGREEDFLNRSITSMTTGKIIFFDMSTPEAVVAQ